MWWRRWRWRARGEEDEEEEEQDEEPKKDIPAHQELPADTYGLLAATYKGMRTQDRWWCSGGEKQHCSLTKSSIALRLCMPGMLGKGSHLKKIRSLQPLLNFSQNKSPHSFSLSSFKNILRPPLGQCMKESYFWMASLNSLAGNKVFHELNGFRWS